MAEAPPRPIVARMLASTMAVVAAVSVAVFVLAAAAVGLRPEGSQIAVWWPAAAVAVGAVAVTTGRRRHAVLVAVAVAGFLASIIAGRPPGVAALFAVANVVEAAVAGYLLGRDGRPALATVGDLGRMLTAATAGAVLAGAITGASDAWLRGGDLWTTGWAVAASHGAAVLVLVPVVMRLPPRSAVTSRWELVGLWTAVPVGTMAVFGPHQSLPLAFVPVAALAWTGLRLDVRTAAAQLLVVGVLAALLTSAGGGPFAHVQAMAPGTAGSLVQVFLVACALVVLVLAVTVAQREAALSALADQRRFDRAVLESVSVAVLACDADGAVVVRNAAQRRLTGVGDGEPVTPDALAARPDVLLDDGTRVPPDRTPLRRALAGEELVDLALRVGPAGSALRDVVATARQIRDDDGRVLGAVVAGTDVTAERAAQARLRESVAFHDAVLAASPDMIYILDADTWSGVWASRTLPEGLGYSAAEIGALSEQGGPPTFVHPADVAGLADANAAAGCLVDGEVATFRFRVRDRAGRYRWISRRITPFARDGAGRVSQVLGIARDITETVEIEQQLADAALHDPLTGLPNRRLLTDRLDVALKASGRDGAEVVVLFCDLDGFKHVNDSGGHAAGDTVLVATAARMRGALRPGDTVARVGGDEFVVVLQPARDAHDVREQAVTVARRILGAVAEPVEVDGVSHVVTASVGVALARPGEDPEHALRDADAAMYRAKAGGKDRHAMYDDTLRADVLARRQVQVMLRSAVTGTPVTVPRTGGTAAGRPWVAYQTMVDLETQQIAGVEAFARLVDGKGHVVPPDAFVPLTEETGLIASLGRTVLDTACADLAGWHARYPAHRTLGVSVNLSARQAAVGDVVGEVRQALDRTGLAAPLLTVELDEDVLAQAGPSTVRALHELRALGVRVAIDRFGTGHTSLRELAQLPITGIKIDRSVIAGLPDDPLCVTIVSTAASLARDLGLTCVAAGIETDAQLLALPPGLVGQGFLLSRPVPAGGIDDELRARRWSADRRS